jgi:hypothetical protein
MLERCPGRALAMLQSRLDDLQAQHLILGKLTGITAADRQQRQSAIYSALSVLAVDWAAHVAAAARSV